MKKKIAILIALVFILPCTFLFGCKKMDRYLSVVPTDRAYKATLEYRSVSGSSTLEESWLVIRKSAFVAEENRDIIYIEFDYSFDSSLSRDFSRTLVHVSGKVFSLNGEHWEAYTGSFGDKWSDIYGSYNSSGSFVYNLTNDINGRDFPSNLKKETATYLEYDFGRDNEVFRISNDMYHILLYYTFDYNDTHIYQNGTITYETPTDTIPYLNTITREMLED